MKNMVVRFLKARNWPGIFLRFSAFMFWFHITIAVGIIIFQPMRKAFLDWIVLHNREHFTIIYTDEPVSENDLIFEMI